MIVKQEIRKQCRELLPLLEQTLGQIKSILSNLPHDFILDVAIKPFDRLFAKMNERKMQDPKQLSDLIRGRLYFPSNKNYRQTIDDLQALLHDKIQNIDYKDRKGKDGDGEYRGIIHVNIKLNGINFELQVLPIEFKSSIEIFHKLYELIRDDKSASKGLRKVLIKLHDQLGEHLLGDARRNRKRKI
jgi:hypothetical protein